MKFVKLLFIFSCSFLGHSSPLFSQKGVDRINGVSKRSKALSPAEQLKTFKLPEGFTIELVASEENGVINPIDLAFDSQGRMWVTTGEMYPLDPARKKNSKGLSSGEIEDYYQLKKRGTDRILIIEDPTKQSKSKLPAFAEGLALPQSVLPYKNGAFVAHGSEMLYFKDENGDGKSDSHETVLTGFGYSDTHTMSHTLVRGPGKWVHFSHGALNKGKVVAPKSGNSAQINFSKIARFSLDGNDLEVVNNGHNNIWGFHLKSNGQWYGCEANDKFFSLVPFHPLMGYKGIGNDRLKPYQPFAPKFHKFLVTGTGISGLAYDENGAKGFPKEWKGAGLLANPITNGIDAVVADRNPDGSVISKHLPNLLTSTDDWFRPVNIEFGPDGCLYIVDWYNKVISHNEVSRDHPDRDKSHGRIWRVRHKSQEVRKLPNIAQASEKALIGHLKADIQWEKRSAWQEIVDRNVTSLIPELKEIVKNTSESLDTRVLALWSLEGLGAYDLAFMQVLAADEDADIRREVMRALTTFKPSIEDVVTSAKPLVEDPHYMVKEQVIRTLGEVGVANSDSIEMLVMYAKPEIKGSLEWGGSYEHNFQRYLSINALEGYPNELQLFLNSESARSLPRDNINEATNVLPKELRGGKISDALASGKVKLDENTLISLSGSLNDPKLLTKLNELLETKEFIQLAVNTQSKLSSSSLQKALVPGLKKLIQSSDEEDRSLAIQAAIAFQSGAINTEIVRLVTAKTIDKLTSTDIDALTIQSKKNVNILVSIVKSDKASIGNKLRALSSVAIESPASSINAFNKLYHSSSDEDKKFLISGSLNNSIGIRFVLGQLGKGTISVDDLDLLSLEKITQLYPKGKFTNTLLTRLRKLEKGREEHSDKQLKAFIKATETLKGDAANGKNSFMICLQCHQVGTEGMSSIEIAPALGGYAQHNVEHLLTAIVKPNEAVEGGYRLYRIVKKNGEIIEGYMYNSSANGTTVAYMGGASVFVPKEQIQSENFIDGRSFMPAMFTDYPDQTMVDLIAYIKSLK